MPDLTSTNVSVTRPLSAPIVSSSTITDNTNDRSKDASVIATDVTLSLKKNRNSEDKGISKFKNSKSNKNRLKILIPVKIKFTENEKENDSRGVQATQAIIQRRRRPKRRSTGVCNVGIEVILNNII